MTYTVAIVINPTRWDRTTAEPFLFYINTPMDETALDVAVFSREPGNLCLETYLDILSRRDIPYELKEIESEMTAKQIRRLLKKDLKRLGKYAPLFSEAHESLIGVPRAEFYESKETKYSGRMGLKAAINASDLLQQLTATIQDFFQTNPESWFSQHYQRHVELLRALADNTNERIRLVLEPSIFLELENHYTLERGYVELRLP